MYNQQIPPFGGGFGFRPQQPMQGYFPQQMQQPQQMTPQISPAAPGVTLVTDRQQAELATVPDNLINLAFITDLKDSRFDNYSVLRPLTLAAVEE